MPEEQSGIPSYEEKRNYTADDIEHIVARRMAKIQIDQLTTDQLALRKELKSDIVELKASVKELVDAWNSAGGMVQIVKYVAGFITAALVVWSFAKGYLKP